jgi:hypothetical protein
MQAIFEKAKGRHKNTADFAFADFAAMAVSK